MAGDNSHEDSCSLTLVGVVGSVCWGEIASCCLVDSKGRNGVSASVQDEGFAIPSRRQEEEIMSENSILTWRSAKVRSMIRALQRR